MIQLLKKVRRAVRRFFPKSRDPGGTSISELLYFGDAPGAVTLPTLPRTVLSASDDFEFAAASVLDRVALGALVRQQNARRIFEIGTFRGLTALTMAANASADAEVFTLDLPPTMDARQIAEIHYSNPSSGFHRMSESGEPRLVGMSLEYHAGPSRIHQLFGNSLEMDFSAYHSSIDLFFVDGCHDDHAVLADTRTAWECLVPGGLLVWHDYTWQSVRRGVEAASLGVTITAIRKTLLAFARKPL